MVDTGTTDPRSLAGRRIVVTRAAPQAAPLLEALHDVGAVPIALPLLEIVDAADGGAALSEAIAGLGATDWLVVLSPNGAKRIIDLPKPDDLPHLAVIAGGTGRVFADAGWPIDLIPDVASSVGLLVAFEDIAIEGRVLIAQAEVGRNELVDGLRARRVDVDVVAAYRNVMPELDPDRVSETRGADAVVFASPSAVERYVVHVATMPRRAICIGSVTASTAIECGFEVRTSAAPTVEAIVDSLACTLGD